MLALLAMFKLRRRDQVCFQMTVSELVVRLIFGCLVIGRAGCYKDSLEWGGVGVAVISDY